MEITWEQVEVVVKPGDKLYGNFIKTDYISFRREVTKLTFWSCIGCLTGKQDVEDGAKYYYDHVAKIKYKIKKS